MQTHSAAGEGSPSTAHDLFASAPVWLVSLSGNYFDWLADSDHTFPPKCGLCNRTLQHDAAASGPNGNLVRLVCKDLFHRKCLRESLRESTSTGGTAVKDLKCPSCNLLLVDPATQPKTKLRESVAAFVATIAAPTARGEQRDEFVMVPHAAAAAASSSSSHSLSPGKLATAVSSHPYTGPAITSRANHEPEPSPRHTSAFVATPSSSSSAYASAVHHAASSFDIESQSRLSSSSSSSSSAHDPAGKHKKSRFQSMRAAGQGRCRRLMQPRRLIIACMTLAFLVFAAFYLRVLFNLDMGKPKLAEPLSAQISTPTDEGGAQ